MYNKSPVERSGTPVDTLVESVDILTKEIVALKAETPRPETRTPIDFKVAKKKASEVDPVMRPLPLTLRLHPLAPVPMLSTVVMKGRKKTNNIPKITGPSITARPLQRKAPTSRERWLIVNRAGGPLPMSALDLRDEINKALVGTYVQTVTVKGLTVTLVTMETDQQKKDMQLMRLPCGLAPERSSVCPICPVGPEFS